MVNMDLTHKQGDPEAREYIVWLVSLCRFAEAVSIGMLIPIFHICESPESSGMISTTLNCQCDGMSAPGSR